MDQQDRERLSRVLSWPEDTAGGLMSTDTVSVRADVSLEVVQRYLRLRGELPEPTDRLFVVDRSDRFLGTLTLARLLTDDTDKLVGACLDPDASRIAPELPAREVSQLFRDRDLLSAPVVDEHGLLLGRITIDDVVDVIAEEARARSDGRCRPARRGRRVRRRAARHAAPPAVAGHQPGHRQHGRPCSAAFRGTIEKVAALAVLMPVVSSMGGIAGTQTVTLIIRGMALGQVQWRDGRWLLLREVGISALTGMAMAVILGAITVCLAA
ncbi:MAG: CBS domain-containing protein [Pseudomonadota bacterium]